MRSRSRRTKPGCEEQHSAEGDEGGELTLTLRSLQASQDGSLRLCLYGLLAWLGGSDCIPPGVDAWEDGMGPCGPGDTEFGGYER